MAKIYGRAIAVGGGAVPDIFGDGSDGDLIVRNGETFTIPVPVPHQSVVEKQYNSILIEAGGTLNCSDHNAGLVLRCKGDCTIQGIIDQSGKSPKPNPNNNYQYPEELVCGDGGKGGQTIASMSGLPYGGGWGSGGPGAGNLPGGTTNTITVSTPDEQLFVSGLNGGGGPGTNYTNYNGTVYPGKPGASGPGSSGETSDAYRASGGAGNYGGGVILLYVGGKLVLAGTISCNGLPGGNGGGAYSNIRDCAGADGAGGGGGGAFYCVHNGAIENSASINVNGGSAGAGGVAEHPAGVNGMAGEPGGLGSITIKQYEKGMTA